MPIYEYRCRDCTHEFEFFHRSSRDRASCPSCASDELDKRFSPFGVGRSAAPAAPSTPT